ncbi:hypothetical protein DICVIV_09235 [Dictyocaulus viviparus]|uniref:Uncharacterized protein n=1 Tax=Dictyocaulus viviparus TaxID=29172 RepID=A0A0D8XLT6_DICVI|nr:hypothetical protein DICVIV_09235 [Dictyocaulus viviparus]
MALKQRNHSSQIFNNFYENTSSLREPSNNQREFSHKKISGKCEAHVDEKIHKSATICSGDVPKNSVILPTGKPESSYTQNHCTGIIKHQQKQFDPVQRTTCYKNKTTNSVSIKTKPFPNTKEDHSANTASQHEYTFHKGGHYKAKDYSYPENFKTDRHFVKMTMNQNDYVVGKGERYEAKRPKDSEILKGDGNF